TDNSELVPVSASLESERVDYSAADNLAGGVEADDSELVPMLTSLESEQVTDNLTGSIDATIGELVPVSRSVESEQVDYSAADDLAGGVDAD
ncbi:SpoIIE-like phosphatase domain protein, partial [Trifolium pratense]